MTAVAKLLPCPFCGSDQVSLSEGETGDGQPWPYVECEDCAATATPENWNRRAALSPAELGGVELTTSFIQEAPDRCDRIIWRGHYYHLPVNSASTPRAAEAVTDEMVDSVRADIMQAAANDGRLHLVLKDEWVRAALTAALSPPSPGAAK